MLLLPFAFGAVLRLKIDSFGMLLYAWASCLLLFTWEYLLPCLDNGFKLLVQGTRFPLFRFTAFVEQELTNLVKLAEDLVLV